MPGVRVDHVRSRKGFVAQIEVNGVISGADYLMPATTRYHFYRQWRPDCSFGDARSKCQLCLGRRWNDGTGAMF